MGFGIGLGAFTDGLKSGIGIARDQEEFDLAKEDRLRRIRQQDEDSAFQREDREFQRSERDRAVRDRTQREGVRTDARKQFDDKVAKGEMSEGQFNEFWNDYAIPKLRNVYLEQGDLGAAQQLDEWAETADAKRGAKKTNEALLKLQTGDHEGAIADIMEASRNKGYSGDNFALESAEPIEDADGNVVGYRLDIGADGETKQQDVELKDIPELVRVLANPAAAFEGYIAGKVKAAEREQEMRDFATKEGIKARASSGKNNTKLRSDAIKSLLDEEANNLDLEEGAGFYNRPKEDQELMINKRISIMTGEDPMPTGRPQVLVDEEYGEAVPVGVLREQQPIQQPQEVLPVRDDEMLDLNWPQGAEDPGVTQARRRKQDLYN